MENLMVMIAFVILVTIGCAIIIELISEKRPDSIINALEELIDEPEMNKGGF